MIPNEKNLQSRLHFPELKTDLYFYHERGGIYYELLFDKHPLFTGTDYRPPACDPFSIPSMVVLLSALAYPEDAEIEYKKGQQNWLKTIESDDLVPCLLKYDAGNQKEQIAAEAYFKRHYTRYIHEDIFSLNDVAGKAPKTRVYMTVRQRNNLRKLFLKNNLGEQSKAKIDAAIEDSFNKLKKDPVLENILFNEEQVTFRSRRSYARELSNIIKRIVHKY